jgi:ubiquitin-like 1-activating enzyme E1 B
VWAKYIFSTLFGPPDDSNILSDTKIELAGAKKKKKQKPKPSSDDDEEDGDGDANGDDGSEADETETTMPVDAAPAAGATESKEPFERQVFIKYFTDEIAASAAIKERWEKRKPPVPLQLDELLASLQNNMPVDTTAELRDQRVLSVAENARLLLDTTRRILTERADSIGELTFDKDDRFAMDFVAAASNLRMACFGIETQSFFTIKGIAGNIVHAIATTNAIAAGMIVLEALKVMGYHVLLFDIWWFMCMPLVLLSAHGGQAG